MQLVGVVRTLAEAEQVLVALEAAVVDGTALDRGLVAAERADTRRTRSAQLTEAVGVDFHLPRVDRKRRNGVGQQELVGHGGIAHIGRLEVNRTRYLEVNRTAGLDDREVGVLDGYGNHVDAARDELAVVDNHHLGRARYGLTFGDGHLVGRERVGPVGDGVVVGAHLGVVGLDERGVDGHLSRHRRADLGRRGNGHRVGRGQCVDGERDHRVGGGARHQDGVSVFVGLLAGAQTGGQEQQHGCRTQYSVGLFHRISLLGGVICLRDSVPGCRGESSSRESTSARCRPAWHWPDAWCCTHTRSSSRRSRPCVPARGSSGPCR